MRPVHVPRRLSMARLVRLLAASGDDRAVLVVPRRAKAFRDGIDFDLFAVYARENGWQPVFVTTDRRLLRLASKAGFEAYTRLPEEYLDDEDLAAAGSEEIVAPPVRVPAWLTLSALILVLGAAVSLLWPRPVLIVTPARQRMVLTDRASLSPNHRESEIPSGRLPARLIEKVDVVSVSVQTSGIRTVGDLAAKGEVTFINDGTERLVVAPGSVVLSAAGVRYRTAAAVTVPPAKRQTLLGVQVGVISGQAKAAVTAETPGTRGNIGPGGITTLAGPLGRLLRVVNTAPMTGGTDRRAAFVTAEDAARAQAEARRQMELEAADELRALAGEEQIVIPELIAVVPGRVNIAPAVGTESDHVRVLLPYRAECLSITRAVLGKFIESRARRRVPAHFTVARDAFDVQRLMGIPGGPRAGVLEIEASYVAVGSLLRKRILGAVLGKPVAEARAAVCALPEVGAVRIETTGGRLPRYAFLIRLILPGRDGR